MPSVAAGCWSFTRLLAWFDYKVRYIFDWHMQICSLGQITVGPTAPGFRTTVALCENCRSFLKIVDGQHYVNMNMNGVALAHHHYKWIGGSVSMLQSAQGLWPVISLALLWGPCVHYHPQANGSMTSQHRQSPLVTSGLANQRVYLKGGYLALFVRATPVAIKKYLYISIWNNLSGLGKLAIDPHI